MIQRTNSEDWTDLIGRMNNVCKNIFYGSWVIVREFVLMKNSCAFNKLETFEDALFESSKTSTHKTEKLTH